jgi:two-component system response regulator YesN
MQRIAHISISFGIGDYVNKPIEIKNSYMQSIESLKYKMCLGFGKVVFFKDILHTNLINPVLQFYDRDMLIDGLKMRSSEVVTQCIDEMFEIIKNQDFMHIIT